MSRVLEVSINDAVVGTLQERAGLWSFTYTPAWLSNPTCFALSPHLPLSARTLRDAGSLRHVQWYFDNLLPEEAQRSLLAKDAKIEAADAFALLEWYGAESAGSLTLRAPEAKPQTHSTLRALSDAALEARIQKLPKTALTHGAAKRMSLAGAQHKLAIVLQDNELFEPTGENPSTHILKPDHPDKDYPHSVINEWFVMKLAKRIGLDVPDVHRRYVPSPVYVIDRFDRVKNANTWQRRHVIDACQLLGLDRSFKYNQGSIETLTALADATRSKAATRAQLYRWLVFNTLIGNSDAHLKNLSFLISSEGIQLAPLYDLLSVASYDTPAFDKNVWPLRSELAWPILAVRHFSDINRDLLLQAGSTMGLGLETANRLLEQLRSSIEREAQTLYDEMDTANAMLVQSYPMLSATLAGEQRCVRTILHIVIKEMAHQLR